MRKLISNDYLTMLIRLAVGITFIYASYYKIIDPGAFAKSIWYYHIAPGSLINLIALVLPWIELLCGVFIIVGLLYRGSVVYVNILTAAFILMLASAIVRNISIDCGCFKAAEASTQSAWRAIWFDVGLIVLTLQLLFSKSRRWMLAKS